LDENLINLYSDEETKNKRKPKLIF